MWVYLFNVHCHTDGSSALYYFLETESKKNPNTVCSFVYDFIKMKMEQNVEFKEVVLLSDSTVGQNKNKLLTTFCSWLAMTLAIPVVHFFPVRGHSFGQCDRNFGVCGRKIKTEEKVHTLTKYIDILSTARENPSPFIIKNGAHIAKKWSEGFKTIMKKKIISKQNSFKIQSYCRLKYPSSGGVLAGISYFGSFQPFSYFKKQDILPNMFDDLPSADKVAMKPAKEADVRSLFRFLMPADVQWYENVFESSHRSEDVDLSEEENGNNDLFDE